MLGLVLVLSKPIFFSFFVRLSLETASFISWILRKISRVDAELFNYTSSRVIGKEGRIEHGGRWRVGPFAADDSG